MLARTDGCAALLFLHDVDKQAGRTASEVERRRLSREMQAAIKEGLDAARERDADLEDLPVVVGLPCRMIEAWVLGSHCALQPFLPPGSEPPPRPEDLWGAEKDPTSDHPKRVLQRALGREPRMEEFTDLGLAADPDEIAETCPESFRPFRESITRLVAECSEG
ncbi:MAG: hypothetical protein ACYDCL_11965 [Myxococcales bacterium]